MIFEVGCKGFSVSVQTSSQKLVKTHKWPATLCLKKFVPGKLWVQKVRAQNIFIDFLAELDFIRNPTKTQN